MDLFDDLPEPRQTPGEFPVINRYILTTVEFELTLRNKHHKLMLLESETKNRKKALNEVETDVCSLLII